MTSIHRQALIYCSVWISPLLLPGGALLSFGQMFVSSTRCVWIQGFMMHVCHMCVCVCVGWRPLCFANLSLSSIPKQPSTSHLPPLFFCLFSPHACVSLARCILFWAWGWCLCVWVSEGEREREGGIKQGEWAGWWPSFSQKLWGGQVQQTAIKAVRVKPLCRKLLCDPVYGCDLNYDSRHRCSSKNQSVATNTQVQK